MRGKTFHFVFIIILLIFGMVSQGSIGNVTAQATPTDITLGGLFPLTGALSGGGVEREAAFRMAIEKINADPTILPDTSLKYLVRDTATDPTTGATMAQELLDLGVFGLVGAASSAVSMAVAAKAEIYQKPQISYSSTNAALSDKVEFPYFLRVVPPDSLQGVALANILIELNVSNVATLSTADDYGAVGINVFSQSFTALGGEIMVSQQFSSGISDVTTQLQAIKNSPAKVIVANMFVGDAMTVFRQAASLGLTIDNGYQWVGTDGLTQPSVYEGDDQIRGAMEGLIGTGHNIGEGPLFEEFLDIWENCNGKTFSQYAGCGDRDPNTFAAFAYDAVYAFALAADALIKAGIDPNNGSLLLQELKITQFEGITGQISFDENQDRNGVYNLLNHDGTSFVFVGRWSLASGLSLTKTLHWVDTYISDVTIADTITSNVITISEKSSEDTSSVVLPYNLFWGVIGLMVMFRFNISAWKKKSKN